MTSIASPDLQFLCLQRQSSTVAITTLPAAFHHSLPHCLLSSRSTSAARCFHRSSRSRSCTSVAPRATLTMNSVPQRNGTYTVGDFMTRKEDLYAVKPTTTVDEALEMLVENRITGFPVIDDDWKLDNIIVNLEDLNIWHSFAHTQRKNEVGLVSDYDLLALDSVSGGGKTDASLFPEVDSTWKTFNHLQTLLSKTNGQLVGDLMTPAPLVVRESTNLEDAARILLETKYRRLPVVDAEGKLVGIITRGNVVRAALKVKRELEKNA